MGVNYILDGELDPGGKRTDARVKQYQAERGLSYEDAYNEVCRESRNYKGAPKPIDGMWPDANSQNINRDLAVAYTSLCNQASGNGKSARQVASEINAIFDRNTIALAAQFVIEARVNQFVSNQSRSIREVGGKSQ